LTNCYAYASLKLSFK